MKDAFSKYGLSLLYEETNFKDIISYPYHFACGMDIICVSGRGTLSTGIQEYTLQKDSELIFLTGTLLHLTEATKDFKVRILGFSKSLFDEVVLNIDTSYLSFLHDTPLYHHPISSLSAKHVNLWMDVAKMICGDKNNQFRVHLEHNFLQSFLMWTCNTIPTKFIFTGNSYTRKQLLYHKFLACVHDSSTEEHDVAYYANSLCISTRYLSEIANECSPNKTPKQLIDEQVTAEIKVLLRYSDLSITQIAEKMKFPDQSYLSRYFKRQTGTSPSDYRIG
jgi:AraC family transcriptional activator of pobA